MPLLLNLLPARFLLTLREWFDYKIWHCVIIISAMTKAITTKTTATMTLAITTRQGSLSQYQRSYLNFAFQSSLLIERQWFICSPRLPVFGFLASAPCCQCHQQIQNLWVRNVCQFKIYGLSWRWKRRKFMDILVKDVFHKSFHLFRIQWVPFVPTSWL